MVVAIAKRVVVRVVVGVVVGVVVVVVAVVDVVVLLVVVELCVVWVCRVGVVASTSSECNFNIPLNMISLSAKKPKNWHIFFKHRKQLNLPNNTN